MKPRRSVALLIETSNAYARGLLSGAVEYIRGHEEWSVHLPELQRISSPPTWFKGWRGDGIIARIETKEMAKVISRKRLPTIDVSAARHLPNIPWVETDDRAISQLAAEHLHERGFTNLAFVGDPGFNWSFWREQHFASLADEKGCSYFVHQSQSRLEDNYSLIREKDRLTKWLVTLPKPVGIMGCYDIKAREVLDACRELDLTVPEQVAVIGADNDEILCNLSDPPLSSVIPNSQRAGFEAASLLDRMMSGEKIESDAILIQPRGIKTRQSTDTLAIDDADVAKALQFIRQYASSGINVNDILRETSLSRRVLESRFTKRLGRTPHQEIIRQKISKVKRLLIETDLSIAEIAKLAGFEHAEYLSVAFKQFSGITPSAYRQQQTSNH